MFRLELDGHEPLLLPPDLSVLIGRGDHCDLQLSDPAASRAHCRVIATNGRVTLTDEKSRWGTVVNGSRIDKCDLRPGDLIVVGETELRLALESDPGRTTIAPPPESSESAEQTVGNSSAKNAPIIPSRITQSEATASDVLPDAFLGRQFHSYHLQNVVATTNSGVVFQATGTDDQPVAVKIFHPDYFADETSERRFERAVRTMIGLKHPRIVEVLNAGKKAGHCFTVTPLIDGVSAIKVIEHVGIAGMLDPPLVLQVAIDLCEALEFAALHDIVHRNIKPSNILVRRGDGAAMLNDLILAKATTVESNERLTQHGEILTDVCFMSPEQLGSGLPVDSRSDIYQLGATLYALLTGRNVVSGHSAGDNIRKVLTENPPAVREFHIGTPLQFEAVVMKMLRKNPADRYQSATEFAKALRKVAAEIRQPDVRSHEFDAKATGWGGALDGLW